MTREEYMSFFNKHTTCDRSTLTSLCKIYYRDLRQALEGALGSGGAFFTAIQIASAIFAADGTVSYDEWELFRSISDTSPTYDEFYDTVRGVSEDFAGAAREACSYGTDARVNAALLATAIYALRGTLTQSEENFLSML